MENVGCVGMVNLSNYLVYLVPVLEPTPWPKVAAPLLPIFTLCFETGMIIPPSRFFIPANPPLEIVITCGMAIMKHLRYKVLTWF